MVNPREIKTLLIFAGRTGSSRLLAMKWLRGKYPVAGLYGECMAISAQSPPPKTANFLPAATLMAIFQFTIFKRAKQLIHGEGTRRPSLR